jgi:YHS domain-containing protein
MMTRIHRHDGGFKAERHPSPAKAPATASGRRARGLRVLVVLCQLMAAAPAPAQGFRMSEEIIADPTTGAALMGFDPVAYFIEGKALSGNRDIQTSHAGKAWYFVSGANKTEFLARPALYLPAFGGHDPVAIAAGFLVAGSPEFFAITGQRVHLFRHAESREAFLRDPAIRAAAESHWPQVKRDLVP